MPLQGEPSVKSALSKHSDGSAGKDTPPTPMDAVLRRKHITESVPYNLRHLEDHGEEICEQLDKLQATDPALAKKLATQAVKKIHKIEEEIEKHGR